MRSIPVPSLEPMSRCFRPQCRLCEQRAVPSDPDGLCEACIVRTRGIILIPDEKQRAYMGWMQCAPTDRAFEAFYCDYLGIILDPGAQSDWTINNEHETVDLRLF